MFIEALILKEPDVKALYIWKKVIEKLYFYMVFCLDL